MSAELIPTPNKRNRQHGNTLLKRALKVAGLNALDRRSKVSKALEQWRQDLISDLGGHASLSTQQKALVDLATRTKLLLDSLDVWLLEQRTLVNSKRRAVVPALIQRQSLGDALARYLNQLGMARKARPTATLADLLSGSTSLPQTNEEAAS